MRGRTKLLLAVLGLGACVLVISMIRGGESQVSFVAPEGERSELDLGNPGPSLGDTTVFSGPLLDGDEPAGRLDGTCVVTSSPADEEERRWRCAVTLTIGVEDGETELQLAAVRRVEAEGVIFSVVGGGGRYREARGDATFDYTGGEGTQIDVRLVD